MRRSAKPAKAKVKAKRDVARKSRQNESSRNRELEKRLAEALEQLQTRNRELVEAQDQQTATGEILRVISTSPTHLQPVLDAVVKSAARFCGAYDATLFQLGGESLRRAAHYGPIPFPIGTLLPLGRGAVSGCAVLERRAVHVVDLLAAAEEFPISSGFARKLGHRTQLSVPLLREGMAIGAISLRRAEVNPFTEKQITLLQTFADQAVIAIENVRLFNQTKEALEQQTATSEILRVIASSPTDLHPVMEVVAESAARFCGATNTAIFRLEGELLRRVAVHGPTPTSVPIGGTITVSPQSVAGRAVRARQSIHIEDILALPEAEFRETVERDRQHGVRFRTALVTPLLREGLPIGVIAMRRTEVQPFTDKQIELAKTFADQAVIAIENVRLFKELELRNAELTESLEQQTAASEILRVIAGSPTDLAPVMDAVTRNAARVSRADHALIGEAVEGRIRWLAAFGTPLVPDEGPNITRQLPSGRAILDCQTTQVEDVSALTSEFPRMRRVHDEFGVRTIAATPLVREGVAIGVLLVRRTIVRRFTDREIELLRTFSDQAVIAIENVRLFTELQARNRELTESLEQQTATAEILRAISNSPTDARPVFDTIAQRAVGVCDGTHCAVMRFDGTLVQVAAHSGMASESVEELHRIYPLPMSADTLAVRSIREGRVIHSPDMLADPSEPVRRLAQVGR